jgi:hypothetical protein
MPGITCVRCTYIPHGDVQVQDLAVQGKEEALRHITQNGNQGVEWNHPGVLRDGKLAIHVLLGVGWHHNREGGQGGRAARRNRTWPPHGGALNFRDWSR